MKLFETSWKKDWDTYERYFDTDLEKSITGKVQVQSEWFEENSRGDYQSILDANIKLVRKQGKSKDGKDQWGMIDPVYRNIRDNYWGKSYNKDPRIQYIDIEVRVGVSFKNDFSPNTTIKIRKKEQ